MVKLLNINARNFCLLAIEDLGHLFESWAPGLDVQEADEEEFEEDPDL
jgi:hypothetical protein